MPCFLFTFHAYGTWLPDHRKGYTQKKRGYQPQDVQLAEKYCSRMRQREVAFTDSDQKIVIDTLLEAVKHINCQLHYVATDRTHIHALVSWKDETPWQKRRNSLKKSITIKLKELSERKTWLSEGSSRRHVQDQEHFDYLMTTYLPRHRGLKWNAEKGMHQ